MNYYAGTFADLKEFATKKEAFSYAKKLAKNSNQEIRVIRKSDNTNYLIN